MSEIGPAFWVQPYGPPGIVVLAGRTIECIETLEREARDPFASLAPLLYGGSVFQTAPSKTQAPIDLDPDTFSLVLTDKAEEEFHAIQRARQLSTREPVSFVVPFVIEDRWIIPATVKTEWVMSRSFAFSAIPYMGGDPATVPRVFVEETPGGSESRVELTIEATGTPGSGEWYTDTSADGYTIETADLTAHAGRVLMLRYVPKRFGVVDPLPVSIPEWNAIEATATLREQVPPRSYVP